MARSIASAVFNISALFACTQGLFACVAQVEPSPEPTAVDKQAIINGSASPSSENYVVSVSIVSKTKGMLGSCTGALLAPNLLLTARHCVSSTDEGALCKLTGESISGGKIYSDYPASMMAVTYGPKFSLSADAYGKEVFVGPRQTLCNNDIALVVLDTSIPNAQIAKIRLDSPPVEGELITSIGYGQNNTGAHYSRLKREDVEVLSVGPTYNQSKGAVGEAEFLVGESICSGDSGGPAVAQSTGAIVGVVSRGGNGVEPTRQVPYAGCIDSGGRKTYNLYTRVDTFKDLIMSAFEAAGAEPWLENGPDPRKSKFGVACEIADHCRSNVCVNNPNKSVAQANATPVSTDSTPDKFCSQVCDELNACPEGFLCTEQAGAKACVPKPPPAPTAAPTNGMVGGGGACSLTRAQSGAKPVPWLLGAVALATTSIIRRRSTKFKR